MEVLLARNKTHNDNGKKTVISGSYIKVSMMGSYIHRICMQPFLYAHVCKL